MRKRIFGRRLKRDRNQRKALFKSLMNSLVLYGKIKTTEAKAKSIKGEIEKLVTLARNKEENARASLMSRLSDERAVGKILSEIAPKFASRPGGYTRLIKMGPRFKDGAKMVLMTWVEEIAPTSFKEPKRKASKVSEVSKVSRVSKKDSAGKKSGGKK
jgi:large subunit ribosomal protein L17